MNQNWGSKLAPIVIILVACGVTAALVVEEEEGLLEAPPEEPLSVEIVRVEKTDYRLQIPAWGIVEARETIDIRAEVSGKVTKVPGYLLVGGRVREGNRLFTIDKRDYMNRLKKARAVLEKARQALEIEKGLQAVAKGEWAMVSTVKNLKHESAALALRQPQLKDKLAAVRIAEAQEAQATLELERTNVRAPCDGTIVSESVAVGQYFDVRQVAMTIACGGHRRLQAFFPPAYTVAPVEVAVAVRVDGKSHKGVIKTVLPQIDINTRQKLVLVELDTEDVPLGAYAELTLPGRAFKDVLVIPANALRPHMTAWVFDEDNTLAVQSITVLARDAFSVVVADGLEAGARIIISHIAHPLKGMSLVVAKDAEALNVGEKS